MTVFRGAAASVCDVGQRAEKAFEIGLYRLHGGLLQHDFRQPDAIRIGPLRPRACLAGANAPGHSRCVAVVPGEQPRGCFACRFVMLACASGCGRPLAMARAFAERCRRLQAGDRQRIAHHAKHAAKARRRAVAVGEVAAKLLSPLIARRAGMTAGPARRLERNGRASAAPILGRKRSCGRAVLAPTRNSCPARWSSPATGRRPSGCSTKPARSSNGSTASSALPR